MRNVGAKQSVPPRSFKTGGCAAFREGAVFVKGAAEGCEAASARSPKSDSRPFMAGCAVYSAVEVAGVEPASKQIIQMLSTCIAFDWFS